MIQCPLSQSSPGGGCGEECGCGGAPRPRPDCVLCQSPLPRDDHHPLTIHDNPANIRNINNCEEEILKLIKLFDNASNLS